MNEETLRRFYMYSLCCIFHDHWSPASFTIFYLKNWFILYSSCRSESSMFVSKRRWILKTCGTTTPLECIEPLLQLADNLAGYTDIEHLFFSRKNFKRPDLQVSPHRGFDEEVALLDSFFDNGRAYCLGSINRDCWYLYTYSRNGCGPLHAPTACQMAAEMKTIDPDQTIEILMTDLDPDVMAIFTKEYSSSSKMATEVSGVSRWAPTAMESLSCILCFFFFELQKSGIDTLLPGMVIDDYLFEPCGYSMNGISKIGVCSPLNPIFCRLVRYNGLSNFLFPIYSHLHSHTPTAFVALVCWRWWI